MKKSNPITKSDLEGVVAKLDKRLVARIDHATESVRSDLKDFRDYTIQRFNKVDGRLDKVENRLDGVEDRLGSVENRLGGVENRLGGVETGLEQVRGAVLEISDTDQHVYNLVKELKGQNIRLNEKRIFAS